MSELSGSENVPEGWTHVRKGQAVAIDTYVDALGVLRASKDDSCVVWHKKGCERTGITPDEIVYQDDTRAPLCPDCVKRQVT